MPLTVLFVGGLKILGWVTLSVAALTCGTVIFAYVQGPRTVTNMEIEDRMAAMDPKEGQTFDLGSLHGTPVIIAVLGDCASCSIHKTDFNELQESGGFRVVGVYEKGAILENVARDYPWLVLAEDKLDLHKRLNAYVKPRAYAFDGVGRLVALQRPLEPLSAFVSRIGGKL